MVWNLVGNAVKFSERGGVVRVSLRAEPAHVVFEVADAGRGISHDFLPHIFDRFRQEDAAVTRRHGGLGLGLSVVPAVVGIAADTAGVTIIATLLVALALVLLLVCWRLERMSPAAPLERIVSPAE